MKKLNNLKYYYMYIFLQNIGRTIPHTILTILLLDKGLLPYQIVFLQVIFTTTILLFETFSGYFSDIYSRKATAIVSLFLFVISYLTIIYLSETMLYISWFLYGLATAFQSGTLDAEVIKDANEKYVHKVTSNTYKISSYSGIIGSLIGLSLYRYIGFKIYYISILLFFITLIPILLFKETAHERKIKKEISHTKGLKSEIISHKYSIMEYLMISTYIFPIFTLWQLIIAESSDNIAVYQIYYILFMISTIVSSKISGKFKNKNALLILMLFLSAVMFFIASYNLILTILIVISTLMNIIKINSQSTYLAKISNQYMSSVISLTSTLVILLSIFLNLIISYFISLSIVNISMILSIVLFSLTFLILIVFKLSNKYE